MPRKSILAMAALAGLGLAFVGTPAQAAEQPQHCVVNVSDASAQTKCYGSFSKAIANATGGRVTDAPGNARKAKTDSGFAAQLNALRPKAARGSVAPAAAIVISIEWEDSGFEDSTLTYSATSGCTNPFGLDWQASSMPSGWNDQIGSYRGFANCLVKHFEHNNFSGVSTAFDGGLADMGWMDDETSSIQWS